MVALGLGALGLGCFRISPGRVNLELDDTDVQQMARQMAESISRSCDVASGQSRPIVAVHRVRNETTQLLSPIFLAKLRTLLTRNAQDRIAFVLSRDACEALGDELPGMDQQRREDERAKPTHALGGTFYSHTLESKEGRSDYVLCTFQLTHLGTGAIVWEDKYEVKRRVRRELFD